MRLTYRTRRFWRRVLVIGGYLALIAALVLVCWAVWLERFVVYGENGASFRFDYVSPEGQPQVAVPPETTPVNIYYNEGADFINTSSDLTRLRGYYITTDQLRDDLDRVREQLQELPEGSAVMLDLKSIYGNFYYSSSLEEAPSTDQADVLAIDRLIEELVADKDLYVIARMPALKDRAYGLAHTSYGLAHPGGYLWAEKDQCYWLDPTHNGTLTRLISIAGELREMGFDEVVFTEFRFPDTDNIVWNSTMTRTQALEAAAEVLVTTCATARFAVSFQTDNGLFNLPAGRSRLYLEGITASGVSAAAEKAPVANAEVNLVFVTQANDTRFDSCGVMRPLNIPTV